MDLAGKTWPVVENYTCADCYKNLIKLLMYLMVV